MLKLRAIGNYDARAASNEVAVECDVMLGRARQAFKEECDINEIVRRFGLTGQLPDNPRVPVSGDFTGLSDFQSAQNAVVAAREAFMEFPAELRARFHHNPQEMMAFCADVANRDEAIKLGMIPKPAERTRDVVQAVDELRAAMVPK